MSPVLPTAHIFAIPFFNVVRRKGATVAKRLTDSTKWKRENFRLLSVKMKLTWLYLIDNCDHSGVWHPDFGLLSFQLGEEVTREEFIDVFGDKIQVLTNGSFFIPSFILFQYGEILNPNNKVHASVIRTLEKQGASKALARVSQGAKDKNKKKEKDKSKEKIKEKEKEMDMDKEKEKEEAKKKPSFVGRLSAKAKDGDLNWYGDYFEGKC